MNWAQFKDPLCYLCLLGTVVASWTLTQEVAGWQGFDPFYSFFVTELSEFRETFRKNSSISDLPKQVRFPDDNKPFCESSCH